MEATATATASRLPHATTMTTTTRTEGATLPTTTTTTPSKSRAFSDSAGHQTPTAPAPRAGLLAPSPTFRERIVPPPPPSPPPTTLTSKDDHDALPTTPKARRRPLSLHMPPHSSLHMPSPSHFPAPLSPQLDRDNIYMHQSPATSLPRHSRGLDFSRASTNLHHSTLPHAHATTPDSSPGLMQRPLVIPRRQGSGNGSGMLLDSPSMGAAGNVPWGVPAPPEPSAVSSSVGSVNMLVSESESSDSDGDASMGGEDHDDPIFTTPQVHKLQNPNATATPFLGGAPSTPSAGAGGLWGVGCNFSPAQASLMKNMRRSRLHRSGKKSRKSSSSASGSGYSSMASPRATSPPPLRSIETAANAGYFNWPTAARSRRESLALGTDGLHLSSGNDSGDEASATNTPSTPGVVRRAVTRRGNLLPKTKGFARIRAALMEEAAPIDTEVRREAETIRQVRERDGSLAGLDLTPSERPSTATDPSSPTLLPAVPEGVQEDFHKDLTGADSHPKGLGMDFASHASRNSGGLDYWNRYDVSLRTPPPPPNFARHGSSAMSDITMEPSSSGETANPWHPRPRTRSSVSDAASEVNGYNSTPAPAAGAAGGMMDDDVHLNRFKRRREDDFDISTIKRRAVSPGMSANNSPVLPQSPSQRDGGPAWGQPPERIKEREGTRDREKDCSSTKTAPSDSACPALPSATTSRHGSAGSSMSLASAGNLGPSVSAGGTASAPGSAGGGGGKKLGLQGMVDTNDGLMKMSIE